MKKITAIALAMVMAVGMLTGCGASGNGGSSTGSGSSAPQTRLDKILASGKIVVATSPDYAPYEFVDLTKMGQGQEQYVGSDMTLARYIADKLGVELVIEAMDYDAVLTAVAEGKCDFAVAGMVAKPDRLEKMDFTQSYNPPVDDNSQGLMIRKEDAEKFKTLDDLNQPGVKVAVQNASLQQEMATKQLPNATQVPITKISDGIMELQQGKVDALVIATTTGGGYAGSYDNLTMSTVYLQSDDNGTAAAVPKGNPELLAKLNEIIDEVLAQDLYTQWENEAAALAKAQQDDSKK